MQNFLLLSWPARLTIPPCAVILHRVVFFMLSCAQVSVLLPRAPSSLPPALTPPSPLRDGLPPWWPVATTLSLRGASHCNEFGVSQSAGIAVVLCACSSPCRLNLLWAYTRVGVCVSTRSMCSRVFFPHPASLGPITFYSTCRRMLTPHYWLHAVLRIAAQYYITAVLRCILAQRFLGERIYWFRVRVRVKGRIIVGLRRALRHNIT